MRYIIDAKLFKQESETMMKYSGVLVLIFIADCNLDVINIKEQLSYFN